MVLGVRFRQEGMIMRVPAQDSRGVRWFAAAIVLGIAFEALSAAVPETGLVRTAYCDRAATAPAIDGRLDDACWRGTDVQTQFFVLGGCTPASGKTEVMCVHDTTALYVAARCYSRNLEQMAAEARRRDGRAWQDDCVELFFVPLSGVCYQVVVSSTGMLYDARSDRQPHEWNPDLGVACGKQADSAKRSHWTFEMAIPWTGFGGAANNGKPWKVNFTRNDTVRGELCTWSIIEGGGFEQPDLFGQLVFRAPTRKELAARVARLARLVPKDDVADAEPTRALRVPGGVTFAISKLAVADCRVVRAFVGAPVDGCTRTLRYTKSVAEYPARGVGPDVDYSYNNNDGLHITLADDQGFDAVVLRGGARTDMCADATALDGPGEGELLWRFVGGEEVEVAQFNERVAARKISFFGVRQGTISDVSFYRLGATRGTGGGETREATTERVSLTEPESEFASESLYLGVVERYPEGQREAFVLGHGTGHAVALPLRRGKAVHLMTEPFDAETGVTAVRFEARLQSSADRPTLDVVVQDPLNPRRDVTSVRLLVPDGGKLSLLLDIPDQVLLKGSRLWITLRLDADGALAGPDGRSPVFHLHVVPRQRALSEALAWRRLLLRSLFGPLSEPRPWGSFKKQTAAEFFAASTYAARCPELFMTIDQCHALDSSDHLSRQIREWVYIRHLDQMSEVTPPPQPPEGVPDWAWYPRLAWLEFRKMVDWWMEERLVPTGEVGVGVQDNSDFYQQLADMPFFERDGVAAKVVDACARMAELADKENLREGINIRATDSLHAYEEGINHMALMARWFYGDPIYLERCMDSARNVEKLTIVTDDGRRHFRDGSRMGYQDVETPRKPAVDGHANPLMWHAALQFTDYNRNPQALKLVREWADTWLRFQEPGRWATRIEVLSGKVLASEKDRPLTGGYKSQAITFLWLFALTGDRRYVEPFLHGLRKGTAPYPTNVFLGDLISLGVVDELDSGTQGRLAEDNAAAALYLRGDPRPFIASVVGRPRNWHAAIDTLYDARRFPGMYTSTHQYTDRVFLGDLQAHPSVSYLGGYCKRNKYNPTQAVGWEGFGTDYAALVLRNRRDTLKAAVYNVATERSAGRVRVWALEHGMYSITVGADRDADLEVDGTRGSATRELIRGDSIDLNLPPRSVTVIEVTQREKLDPIFTRADLAIAAREVAVEGTTVTGTVHNLGSADVADAVVAVVGTAGKALVRMSVGALAAPLDLLPKRKPFELELPSAPREGWKLVLDPDNRVPEIYEGNNAVILSELPAADYTKGWE